jgi:hypothetical protein
VIVAASSWGYVAGAYLLVLLVILAYVVRTVVLARRVGRSLPPEERRWM